MNKKIIAWAAVGVVLVAALVVGLLSVQRGYFVLAPSVQLLLNGEETVVIDAHSDYDDPGVTARKGKTDLLDQVVVDGAVDTTVPGDYTITYTIDVKGKTYTVQRMVSVVDREAPALELIGDAEMRISARKLYEEPGFTALDRCDGDLTDRVVVTETEEETGEGKNITLTYTVSDAAGNEATVQRRLLIRDVVPPTITLKGYTSVYVTVGSSFKDPGYSASDDVDGDLTSSVKVSGSVNTSVAGTYTLTYAVSDGGGNRTEAQRTVKVYTYEPNPKNRVYLTFDDGPSANVTPQVLDILKANNVQATFFIISYSNSNKYLVQRMINEGHTVAIHGYSHDYAKIYASDEAFMQNIYKLRDRLLADFGYNATIIRFPGGSSNTVSASYNKGIMTRLAARVQQEGFSYFDWNVSSGDASATKRTKTQIYNAVVKGLRPGRNNVVLMHDAGGKQTTVDALQDIINYAKANGYVLAPITPGTAPVHHGIAN